MREIKFRVWDKEHKMFLPNEIYDIHSRTSFGSFGIMRKDWRNYSIGEYFYDNAQILEQYTGLKDKNGKEIYEGDILIDNFGRKWVVRYNNKMAAFMAHFIDSDGNTNQFQHFERFTSTQKPLEVIGNIHNNPNLS